MLSFIAIYKEIFQCHINGRVYGYSAEARKKYIEFSDKAVKEANDVWAAGRVNSANYSKDRRNLSK